MKGRLDYHELRELMVRFPRAAQQGREAVQRAILREVAPKVLRAASAKAPKLWNVLEKNCWIEQVGETVSIVFGGLASKYVERQHEDDSLSHPGRYGKYVYQYGEPKVPPHPGEWNDPVGGRKARRMKWVKARAGSRGAVYRGALGTQRWDTGGRWRRLGVTYSRRQRSETRMQPGQAHFLYGARNSAWEELEEWAEDLLVRKLSKRLIDALEAA